MRQLRELCDYVGGQLIGDPDLVVTGAASTSRVVTGDITFVNDAKYLSAFENSAAIAAIAAQELESEKPLILCERPELAFAKIVSLFRPVVERKRLGISPAASVSPTAQISDDVDIYPGAVIGDDVEIGCGTIIHPNVTIMDGCKIGAGVVVFPSAVLYPNSIVGDRCLIHAGVVIGAYGFGYKTHAGRHVLSAQLGNVILESDVEIGANTTIDRSTYDSTVIGEGTKIDDLVMIGHNCQIGKHNILCSQVGIAGSCSTGDYVVMAGQAGIGDHLHIGSNATIQAKSGVMHNVEEGQALFGIPAKPLREQMQQIAMQAKLPEMRRKMKKLGQRLEQIETSSPAITPENPQSEAA